jgi:hypothetical protein
MWGENVIFKDEAGQSMQVADWNMCPADLQQITAKARRWFGLRFGEETTTLGSFHGDPEQTPVLFFSGGRTIRVDQEQRERLRSFVLSGGMLVFDSIAGSPFFYRSARDLVAETFPEYAIRMVPLDHPLYHMLYDVTKVSYPKNLDADTPHLEGIYVGSRLGAVLSKYGLGCGWDDREVPLIPQAVYYDVDSANKIGLNLIAYAVGYAYAGREEAKPELFGSLDEKAPTDEFVFAQIRHGGAWNVHPGAASSLLRRLRQSTSLRVSLKRAPVSLGEDEVTSRHFLYLTGLDDFQFDERERAALRRFLNGGGTLFVNNGLGLRTFHEAVVRELKTVLPDATLAPLPVTHPIYSSVFTLEEASYTPAVAEARPDLKTPYLEGVVLDGDLRVIYSPFDLEAAWLGCEYPLAKAYQPDSGLRMGMNLVMYAMTH